MTKIFIDGKEGTTGLRIFDRLSLRDDLELLTLPVNLAIDTMKKRDIPTRKPTTAKGKQFRDRAIASNQLLDYIQKASANLEPGATVTLEGFTIQLQRVNAGTQMCE